MKSSPLLAGAIALLAVTTHASAGTVDESLYAAPNFTDTGSSITFSGSPAYTSSFSSTTGWNFDYDATPIDGYTGNSGPFFAINFTGTLDVAASGTYTFTIGSDDAEYLFIGGAPVAQNPGIHPYSTTTGSIFLTAGAHSFDVQYDQLAYVAAQSSFATPSGVSIGSVPEPSTWAMMLLGFVGLGFAGYRKARSAVSIA